MTSRQYQTQEPPEKLELPDLLEHLKYAYFFEHQRREEIEKRIQAPVTILVGLIGGFFALTFQSLKYWHPGAVGALFLLNLVFLSITAFYFGRFMWPRNYLYVRLPLELLNQYRDIIDPPKPKEDSERKEENPDSIQLTRENFTDYLMEYYAHPTSHNRDVNMKRSDDYAMGWRFLFFTLAIEGAWVVLYLALAILSS